MKLRHIGLASLATALVAAIVLFCVDSRRASAANPTAAASNSSKGDTLRAVTMYGATSYFQYHDQPMGLDYEMLARYASAQGLAIDLKVAADVPSMLCMLREGKVDMIAYGVPKIAEYTPGVRFCGKSEVNHQVLVQPKSAAVRSVPDLIGKTVYVEKDSKYQYRMANLADELGGGIGIEAVVSDTIESVDLVRMVSDGSLPMTVADSDMADICADLYGSIDVSVAVSTDQESSWVVADDDRRLGDSIDAWAKTDEAAADYDRLRSKYYRHAARSAMVAQPTAAAHALAAVGSVRYEEIFRRYASRIGWDWRQLAAIAYTESRFDPTAVSWAGATGLMQLMPSTARQYAVTDMTDPEQSVLGASLALADIDKSLCKYVSDPTERRKFVIAAYNSGLGHILDAIALARRYGRNPGLWYGGGREMALLKTTPQYYNDPVVKHGYFRGQETVGFVDKVLGAYEQYLRTVPECEPQNK